MLQSYLRDIPEQPPLWPLEGPQLEFALRRHQATRLHWDLRIKARGMLYSWSMPRPPSLDPTDSVRATLQAPHKSEDLYSERRIPEGFNGAGPTLVEDCGLCTPQNGGSRSQETLFHCAFLAGRIDLLLEGHILHGAFRFERVRSVWRIRKIADAHASVLQPEWPGRSVLSGRLLSEL